MPRHTEMTKRRCGTWILAALISPVFGQFGETLVQSKVHSAALISMVDGFNFIRRQGADLRNAMKADDVKVFDAVMWEVTDALLALPGISTKTQQNPTGITPRNARPDRIPRLAANLARLEQLFGRLSQDGGSPATHRLFRQAWLSARKMLSALPASVPTVDAKMYRGSR
jgi:hypothetical protein